MPPRKKDIPAEANPELEEDTLVADDESGDEDQDPGEEAIAVVEAPAKPVYRTLKYLGKEPNWECFATSPPLKFVDRVCDKVPEGVAKVIIKNKKKNGLPLFRDITPNKEPLTNPETEGEVAVDNFQDIFGD